MVFFYTEYMYQMEIYISLASHRLPSTAVRMNHERLPLTCYIVDDVMRPNMAYTEYNLIILSHIVLAKYSITSREIF
jgi:hypothetical protein